MMTFYNAYQKAMLTLTCQMAQVNGHTADRIQHYVIASKSKDLAAWYAKWLAYGQAIEQRARELVEEENING